MSTYEAKWQKMITDIDSDLEKLQAALRLLNQVWITKPETQDGLREAIKHIGGEIALMQRKRAEVEYYKNKQNFDIGGLRGDPTVDAILNKEDHPKK